VGGRSSAALSPRTGGSARDQGEEGGWSTAGGVWRKRIWTVVVGGVVLEVAEGWVSRTQEDGQRAEGVK